jgi:Cu/Zn superoxide dismutase
MKVALITLLVAGLAAGNLAFAQEKAKSAKKAGAKSVTVKLAPQNKSGESGTARLTAEGDQTKVVITLKGAPKGVAQPAHIHDGTCAKLDPKPKHGLENVVDGKSTTTVPVKLDALLSGGRTAINVHKSTDDIKTYVACGNIRPASAAKKGESKKASPKS